MNRYRRDHRISPPQCLSQKKSNMGDTLTRLKVIKGCGEAVKGCLKRHYSFRDSQMNSPVTWPCSSSYENPVLAIGQIRRKVLISLNCRHCVSFLLSWPEPSHMCINSTEQCIWAQAANVWVYWDIGTFCKHLRYEVFNPADGRLYYTLPFWLSSLYSLKG